MLLWIFIDFSQTDKKGHYVKFVSESQAIYTSIKSA